MNTLNKVTVTILTRRFFAFPSSVSFKEEQYEGKEPISAFLIL